MDLAALNAGTSLPHRSLAFAELFTRFCAIEQRRAALPRTAPVCVGADLAPFRAALGFALTSAQNRVIDEVLADLARPRPMRRLVIGDVGSGKTAVMFAAALAVMQAGYQVAVLAPTGMLAEQHYKTFLPWFTGGERESESEMALLHGGLLSLPRRALLDDIANDRVGLVVGTHALLSEGVRFARLGLVIVDEEHLFGVEQRQKLLDGAVGYLGASATPIPRSVARVGCGMLDVSVIDEMPPGRLPVEVKVRIGEQARAGAYDSLVRRVQAGEQAFVVAPLISPSPDLPGVRSVEEVLRHVRTLMPDIAVGLAHGEQRPDERDAAMRAFRDGDTRVLVATTVIQVGVDVPGATIMMVEQAERFGLAQLYQLRGRPGRRAGQQGFCILLSPDSEQNRYSRDGRPVGRCAIIKHARNGFDVAEADTRARGPGDVFGTEQSGLPVLRFADLARDAELVEMAAREARALVEADPRLELPEHAGTRAAVEALGAVGGEA